MVQERNVDVWQLMRSDKHYDQQNQGRFRCFHSFTGCDPVSAFAGKRKKKCIWRMYLKITESFNELSVNTGTIDAENDALTESALI